jgi:dCMP deaminase
MNIEITKPRSRPTNIFTFKQEKYQSLWMNIALMAAMESTATRRKVGACVVTSKLGVYVGYNGVLSSDNICEDENGLTKEEVIHAEANALDKMLKEGVSSDGSVIYITLSPCMSCCKRIVNAGVVGVFYQEEYRCTEGIKFLRRNGVVCLPWSKRLEGSNEV